MIKRLLEFKTFVLHISRSAEEKAKVKEEGPSEEADTSDDYESEEESVPAYVRVGESQIIYEITETEYELLMDASQKSPLQDLYEADIE